MATTYILKGTASDLTGGSDFSNELSPGTDVAGSIAIGTANATTEQSLGFTVADDPGNQGTSVGTFTVKVNVTSGNTAIQLSVALGRYNSAGVQQVLGSFTLEQQATAGVKTFSPVGTTLGTWAAGDRLAVVYRHRSTQTMGGAASITIETGTTNAEVIAPWDLVVAPTVKTGADAASVGLTEATTNVLASISGDSSLVGTSDQVSISAVLQGSDTTAVGATDSATLQIAMAVLVGDTTSVGTTEQSSILVRVQSADVAATAITEALSILSSFAVSDAPTLSVTDAIDVFNSLNVSDVPTISVAEAITLISSLAASDDLAVSVVDTSSVLQEGDEPPGLKAGSDTASVGLTDASTLATVLDSRDGTDAIAILVTEGAVVVASLPPEPRAGVIEGGGHVVIIEGSRKAIGAESVPGLSVIEGSSKSSGSAS